jgi:hypothetical protein
VHWDPRSRNTATVGNVKVDNRRTVCRSEKKRVLDGGGSGA